MEVVIFFTDYGQFPLFNFLENSEKYFENSGMGGEGKTRGEFERGYFKTLHRVGCFENFSFFLKYNRIGVPYGHDFFTGAKK